MGGAALTIALCAGVGVGVPTPLLLGLCLVVVAAGRLHAARRVTPSVLAQTVVGAGLLAGDPRTFGGLLPAAIQADAMGLLIAGTALVVQYLLDLPRDAWASREGVESGAELEAQVATVLGVDAVRIAFPISTGRSADRHDPTYPTAFADPATYVDFDGEPVPRPDPSNRAAIGSSADPIALLSPPVDVDAALRPALLPLLSQAGRLAGLRHTDRLQLAVLDESRRRLVTTADDDLARIRGLLQRTVLDRLDRLQEPLARVRDALPLLAQLANTRHELQRLGAGLDPTRGHDLATALATLVDQDPTRVSLAIRADAPTPGVADHSAEPVDSSTVRTLWFVASESLTNIHKHVPGAHLTLSVSIGERVDLVASDDGPGGVPPGGLVSIRDRVLAAGGYLDVTSGPDGTRLHVVLPRQQKALPVGGKIAGNPVPDARAVHDVPAPAASLASEL